MMVKASTMFRELKAGLQKNVIPQDNISEEDRSLLRHKYAGHDLKAAEGNDDRALGVVRDLYETVSFFLDCRTRHYMLGKRSLKETIVRNSPVAITPHLTDSPCTRSIAVGHLPRVPGTAVRSLPRNH